VLRARNALRFTAVLTGLFGAVLIARPSLMVDLFDFAQGADSDFWSRRSGVAFAAFTIVFWAGSKFPSSVMQRPILWAALVLASGMAVLSVIAIFDHRVNAFFWVVAGWEILAVVWFGWLLVAEKV
jgi:hypothetical protein